MIEPGAHPTQVADLVDIEHQKRVADLRASYRRTTAGIMLLMIIFLIMAVAATWFANQLPNLPLAPVAHIERLRATGPTALCPGEMLTYRYELVMMDDGVLEIDRSTLRVEPLAYMQVSPTMRLVAVREGRTELSGHWMIPETGRDTDTGDTLDWLPGHYMRVVAVSTASRNTMPAIAHLNFTIREDCNERS